MRRPGQEFLTLSEICDLLGISVATGRNWVRRGQLEPQRMQGRSPYFSQEYVAMQKRRMKDPKSQVLKKRRNKNYVVGRQFDEDYLGSDSENASRIRGWIKVISANHKLTALRSQMVLAEAAIRLLHQRCRMSQEDFDRISFSSQKDLNEVLVSSREYSYGVPFFYLKNYLEGRLDPGIYADLLEGLIDPTYSKSEKRRKGTNHRDRWIQELNKLSDWPELPVVYREGEDVLGLLYLSCRSLSRRKSEGAYYTPAWIVRRLMEHLQGNLAVPGIRICDPCCGTGNFLIQLPDFIEPGQIYGNDIDALSAALTRINLALRYPEYDPEQWVRQITCKDYLLRKSHESMDLILGNPPWGSHFTEAQRKKLKTRYECAVGHSMESCDLILERALNHLSEQGTVAFVLPESILQVRSHEGIRQVIYRTSQLTFVEYLDNSFHGVQCPCILLGMERKSGSKKSYGERQKISESTVPMVEERRTEAGCMVGMKVYHKERSYQITEERPDWNLSATDEEYEILRKIHDVSGGTFLKGHAEFALGIVTGDNHHLLTEDSDVDEPILRGTDIFPFRIHHTGTSIQWDPKRFQQAAPESAYRTAPKIVYRFIGDHPVAAIDRQGRLTLNSCNLILPDEETFDIEVLVAVFNSSVAAWYWRRQFRTMKILRRQLEAFPIPPVSESEKERIIREVRRLESESLSEDEVRQSREALDRLVGRWYHLTEEEIRLMASS